MLVGDECADDDTGCSSEAIGQGGGGTAGKGGDDDTVSSDVGTPIVRPWLPPGWLTGAVTCLPSPEGWAVEALPTGLRFQVDHDVEPV